jgi:hypothetical protein
MKKHNILKEDTSKADITKEVTKQLNGNDIKNIIDKIVKDRIKNDSALEGKVVEISKNVITQLFKALWVKRGVWVNNLSNKSS